MLTFGFYNSINHDRRYNAEEVSAIFNNLITDGVFMNIGQVFNVLPTVGLQVKVGSGWAWFNSTWTYNDADHVLTFDEADPYLNRIDAVVLEVNSGERTNSFAIVKGENALEPVKPELVENELVHQHVLAYVTIPANTSEITDANIEIMVGKSACPYVTGILQTVSVDSLFRQWDAEFTNWFSELQTRLSGDVAARLAGEVLSLLTFQNKLPDQMLRLYDLPEGAKFEDLLTNIRYRFLFDGENYGYVKVRVIDINDQPVEGLVIPDLYGLTGYRCITDADGYATGLHLVQDDLTITIPQYIDMTGGTVLSLTGDVVKDETTDFGTFVVGTFEKTFVVLTSSQNVAFSSMLESVDVSCVGGGGGGSGGGNDGDYGGGGGGGGHAVIIENITPDPNQSYPAIVGGGGGKGSAGGTTSLLNVSAGGGAGGNVADGGGAGNGDGGCGYWLWYYYNVKYPEIGGHPHTGGNATQYGLSTTDGVTRVLYGGGGGGGGDSSTFGIGGDLGGAGGAPYGGRGGNIYTTPESVTAQPGTGYGGGGGGGGGSGTGLFGAGYQGVIVIHFNRKEAAA